MTAVASNLAEYLQAPAYWSTSIDAAALAMWGDLGRESAFVTPIDGADDAADEAERQLAFLSRPMVEEAVTVAEIGLLDAYRGRCVTIVGTDPGYEGAGALVFVLGGEEDPAAGTTRLVVLRRLAD